MQESIVALEKADFIIWIKRMEYRMRMFRQLRWTAKESSGLEHIKEVCSGKAVTDSSSIRWPRGSGGKWSNGFVR